MGTHLQKTSDNQLLPFKTKMVRKLSGEYRSKLLPGKTQPKLEDKYMTMHADPKTKCENPYLCLLRPKIE